MLSNTLRKFREISKSIELDELAITSGSVALWLILAEFDERDTGFFSFTVTDKERKESRTFENTFDVEHWGMCVFEDLAQQTLPVW